MFEFFLAAMLLAPPTVWLPLLRSCMKNLVGTFFLIIKNIYRNKNKKIR